MRSKLLRLWLLAFGSVLLALALGSCGKVADGTGILLDSNTNWIKRCSEDDGCSGGLRCFCGQCTKPCSQTNECSLLGGAECAASGQALCGEEAGAGGLCVLACSENSECGSDFDCVAGQCVPRPCPRASTLDWDQLYQTINSDLARMASLDTPYMRYLFLGNAPSGAGGCDPELDVRRKAMTKLVNSLSTSPRISVPVPIDAAERIYRLNLRDYDWDSPHAALSEFYADKWDAVAAQDPYAVRFVGDDADDVVAGTGTPWPVLSIGSFITAATEPEVYYAMIALPQSGDPTRSLDDFMLRQLNVQVGAPTLFQAGWVDRGVEFLAEQWQIQSHNGYLWMISDYARQPNELFTNPLAGALGDHELVYTLPNGLHAFAFMSADGRRLDSWTETLDFEEADGRARVPRSNLRRHPKQVEIRDEVRERADANSASFSSSDLALIQQLFPGPELLEPTLERDFQNFPGRTLARMGIDPDEPEPILVSFAAFQADVTLEVAADQLMLTPDDLRDNLLLLDPELAPLDGGSVPRSTFTEHYLEALCVLSSVLDNQPDPALCLQ